MIRKPAPCQYEVVCSLSNWRLTPLPTANTLPFVALTEAKKHTLLFWLGVVLAVCFGSWVTVTEDVVVLALVLIFFNYTLSKQALHWVYLDISSVQALVLCATGVTGVTAASAFIVSYAAPDMELPNPSLISFLTSALPLSIICMSKTFRFSAQN